jgi:putative membrane protein
MGGAVIPAAIAAGFHYLALGVGLGSVFARGRALREYRRQVSPTSVSLPSAAPPNQAVLLADNFWGLAALLWISTGSLRAFAGQEKGAAWYLGNTMFKVKILLFGLVFLLELRPMITFIRWRIADKRGAFKAPAAAQLSALILLNDLELALILLLPFVAVLMARGIGY